MIADLLRIGLQVEEEDLAHFLRLLRCPHDAPDDSESSAAFQQLSETLAESHQNDSLSRLHDLVLRFADHYGIPRKAKPSSYYSNGSELKGRLRSFSSPRSETTTTSSWKNS